MIVTVNGRRRCHIHPWSERPSASRRVRKAVLAIAVAETRRLLDAQTLTSL
jgi:hypothetical protein